jgi:hypothetical protein
MQELFSQNANFIFDEVIALYHILDSIDQEFSNPHDGNLNSLLYQKSWIDTVQWHVEDLIREPEIEPTKGIQYKRLIDKLNQQRTDIVEKVDDYFLNLYTDVIVDSNAKLNTESPAWAVDRLSILALKIYHMRIESERIDIDDAKRQNCSQKLEILLEQRIDLSAAIDELLSDISEGKKKMKVYRQLKMYNDPETNPVLYSKK